MILIYAILISLTAAAALLWWYGATRYDAGYAAATTVIGGVGAIEDRPLSVAGRPMERSRANGASAAPALATQRVLIDLAVRNDEALAATARNLLAQPDIAESLSFRLVESELDAGYPLGLGDLVGISTNRAGRGRLLNREARIRGMQFVSGSGVIDVVAELLESGLPGHVAGVVSEAMGT